MREVKQTKIIEDEKPKIEIINRKKGGEQEIWFSFTNTDSAPYTTNLFNTQQYLSNIVDPFNPPALIFEITGAMNYNQWVQDCLVSPKLITRMKILTYTVNGGVATPSSSPQRSVNVYYQDSTGVVYSYYKNVKTLVSEYQFNQNIVTLDFENSDNRGGGDFIIDNNCYIQNYTFPAKTQTTFSINFKELDYEWLLWGNHKGIITNNGRSIDGLL